MLGVGLKPPLCEQDEYYGDSEYLWCTGLGLTVWYDQLVETIVVYVPNVFRYYVRSLVERNTYIKYDGYNTVTTVHEIQYMEFWGVQLRSINVSHSFENIMFLFYSRKYLPQREILPSLLRHGS